MAKISISEFAQTHKMDKGIIYALTKLTLPPDFLSKSKDNHWLVDTAKAGAKKFIAEYAGSAQEKISETKKSELQKAKEDKIIYAAKILELKSREQEVKLKALTKQYVHTETMLYYFTFFQRAINDSYSTLKKISRDLERLYKADRARDAEKLVQLELCNCYKYVFGLLEDEINKDIREVTGTTK